MPENTEPEAADTVTTESSTTATDTTADQADKDWKAEADKWREMARKHETDSRKRAGAEAKLALYEEAQKTEAQKAIDRADAAERRASESERELARYRVAVTKKLPAELADRLRGDTPEELAADADALLALVKVSSAPALKPDPSQGARQSTATAPDMNSLLRAAAGRT